MSLPDSDTRLLLAGVAALVALMAYLGVAFAGTHASVASGPANRLAPWTPYHSTLVAVPLRKPRGFAVRVSPATNGLGAGPSYGAVVQTLVSNPVPGRRYAVGLWLRGIRPGLIGFEFNEFRGTESVYPFQTTFPATTRWHHYTFRVRVKGDWLGLAIYVYRPSTAGRRTWFELRGLTVEARPPTS